MEQKQLIAEINAGIEEEHRSARSEQELRFYGEYPVRQPVTRKHKKKASSRRPPDHNRTQSGAAKRKSNRYRLTTKGKCVLVIMLLSILNVIMLTSGGVLSSDNIRPMLLQALDQIERLRTPTDTEPEIDYVTTGQYSVYTELEDISEPEPTPLPPAQESETISEPHPEVTEEKGRLMVVLRDYDTGERLQGAIFALYDESGDFVTFLVTDDHGEAISDLPLGNYLLQESRAAENYEHASGSLVLSVLPGTNSIEIESRAILTVEESEE